jgi:ABC-2 type transport system ATP-binding protein
MGAGAYVGRIGGLAVALGIGAAVFTGQGVASAETSDGSDSSSTASSASSDASGSASTSSSSEASTQSADQTDPSSTSPSTSSGESDATSSTNSSTEPSASTDTTSPGDAPEPKDKAEGETPEASKDSSSHEPRATTTTRPKKKSSEAPPSSSAKEAPAPPTEATAQTTSDTAEETQAAVEDPEPIAGETVALETEPADVVLTDDVEQEAAPTVATPDPGDAVTVAIENVVTALFNPDAGTAPTTPVDSPAEWALLAAARRDIGAKSTLDAAPVTTNSLEEPAATVVQPVVGIEQTPLLAPLQQIAVVGPLFVTPAVAFIKQIPFVGDILHPIIGYPLGLTGGTTPRDVKVVSFDGTPIYVHFFPAPGLQPGQTAPTILNGPGLSLPGETNPTAETNPFLPDQVIGMAPLLRNGYNVITWDPRGEWSSGGQLEINSPDFEARDVSAIISWLSQQPEACATAGCDPRIGMVGASYGGGIQLVTAAIDPPVDAIVPTIAWNSLNSSLYKAEAFKSSWGTLLSAALTFTFARTNPRILPAAVWGLLSSTVTPADQQLLDERGPDELVADITAPTLLIQGTVDTLFTLQEAHENAMVLIGNGVPTKVLWYCGGHGACISSAHDGDLIEQRTLEWLARYVKGDVSVSTGPQFEWVDQRGEQYSSNTYPVVQGPPLVASTGAGGVLPLIPLLGGSGPQPRAFEPGPIQGLLGFLSGARAANALNLTTPAAATTTYIVGAPQLTFTYSGTGVARHVYAQLVDDTTGLVLGNLVTPVPVTLDGQTHTVTVPMEMVAHTLRPGETVTLQLVASAVSYQTVWSLGTLSVSSMQLALPTADASAISSPSEAETTNAA